MFDEPSTTRRAFLQKAIMASALAASGIGISLSEADTPAAVVNPGPPDSKDEGAKTLAAISSTEPRYNGTAAVWFSSHYEIDPRDWTNIKEFGNPYHPLAGYYKSDDPAILQKQLHWMRRAGIDAIVYDVFSTGAWNLTDLPKDKTLRMLLEALGDQQNESRKLKLIIWFEKYWGMPTPEEYVFAMDYVKEHMASQDFYFKYLDKPLVVPYLNGPLADVDDAFEKYRGDFAIRYIRAGESDFWSYIEQSPQQKRKGWMCASPGMNAFLEDAHVSRHMRHETSPSLEEIRARAAFMPRRNGATFVQQLTYAKSCDPEIIFLSGWNDWQYGCQIEPAVEYEYLYLDIAAKALGRWDETRPYREA
jgi:hypothetical protein